MKDPSNSRDQSASAPGSEDISAGAERAREHVRAEFDQFRAGIEKLQGRESDGEGPIFSASGGAEHAREQLRGQFEQLRAGIERTLRALDDGRRSAG